MAIRSLVVEVVFLHCRLHRPRRHQECDIFGAIFAKTFRVGLQKQAQMISLRKTRDSSLVRDRPSPAIHQAVYSICAKRLKGGAPVLSGICERTDMNCKNQRKGCFCLYLCLCSLSVLLIVVVCWSRCRKSKRDMLLSFFFKGNSGLKL